MTEAGETDAYETENRMNANEGAQQPEPLHHANIARQERAAALRVQAGRLAHQLRNPLAAVKAACSSLQAEITDPEQRETLELALQEVDRMLRFVSATAQATAPGTSEKAQPINLASEISAVMEIVRGTRERMPDLVLKSNANISCRLPRDQFRVSLYSLLEHLSSAPGVASIVVRVAAVKACAQVVMDITGDDSTEDITGTGMIAAANGMLPVGPLVAERFARDIGGRLMQSHASDGLFTFTLELPCAHV